MKNDSHTPVRTLAQAYTHRITLKRDFKDYRQGEEFTLFDDGDVLIYEATILRPEPDMAAMVRNYEELPELFSARKNLNYLPKEILNAQQQ